MREGTPVVTRKHLEAAAQKVHPTMNERLTDYYRRVQGFFKGGLREQVQPPEYQ